MRSIKHPVLSPGQATGGGRRMEGGRGGVRRREGRWGVVWGGAGWEGAEAWVADMS